MSNGHNFTNKLKDFYMNKEEEQTLISVLNSLSKKVENRNHTWTGLAMKVAASISTAGIIAVLALFTTTIPQLKQGIAELGLKQEYMAIQLAKIGEEPRFTLKDYNLEEREQRSVISDMKAQLEFSQQWRDKVDTMLMRHEFILQKYEKERKE